MKRLARIASLLVILSIAFPTTAAVRRPLACEAAGIFRYVGPLDAWIPVEIQASGSCTGDMGGPYRVTIDGSGLADDLSRCSMLSNALMDVTVTLVNTNSGKTTVLSQKWNIYFTAASSVGVVLIRAPISGTGLMLTRLFNGLSCSSEPPTPPYQSAAVIRWGFVR